MKLQKSTLALLVVAIAMGSGVLIYETQYNNRDQQVELGEGERLFTFEESAVQSLTIERADATLTFQKKESGTWTMTEPQQAPAEPAAIAFLLNILTSDPSTHTLEATVDQLGPFGLDDPTATLTLTLQDSSTHVVTVGGTDFRGDSLYATIADPTDPTFQNVPEATLPVHVVSGGLTNAIERPIDGWLAPDEPAPDEPAPDEPDSGEPTPEEVAPEEAVLDEPAAAPASSEPSDIPSDEAVNEAAPAASEAPSESVPVEPEATEPQESDAETPELPEDEATEN